MTTFDLENVANLIRSESQEIDEYVKSEGSYDLSDVELTNLTIRNGSVDDIELDGDPILEYYGDSVVVDPDSLADLIVDKFGVGNKRDQGVELAQLGKIIESCLDGSTTLICDDGIQTMSVSEIQSAIVSQFNHWLNENR